MPGRRRLMLLSPVLLASLGLFPTAVAQASAAPAAAHEVTVVSAQHPDATISKSKAYWKGYRAGYRQGVRDGQKDCHKRHSNYHSRSNKSDDYSKGYVDGYRKGYDSKCH